MVSMGFFFEGSVVSMVKNIHPEFQATSCLYFLMSDSKGAMMASKGTDSSSF